MNIRWILAIVYLFNQRCFHPSKTLPNVNVCPFSPIPENQPSGFRMLSVQNKTVDSVLSLSSFIWQDDFEVCVRHGIS